MDDLSSDEFYCHLLADFLVVLANPSRLRMFCAVRDCRMTVTELAEYAGISLPNASQHLRIMRDKGAITSVKEGQRVYYTVADPRFVEAAQLMRDALIDSMQCKMKSIGVAKKAARRTTARDQRPRSRKS